MSTQQLERFDPLTAFDAAKPIRALVLSHLAQTHGLLDITSLGYSERIKRDPNLLSEVPEETRSRIERVVGRVPQPQIAAHVLVPKVDNRRIVTDPSELALAFAQREPLFNEFNQIAVCGLLVLAWERCGGPSRKDISRGKSGGTPSPMSEPWEFFYHCRNAAAHEGRFTFKGKEPRFTPGKWRGLEITEANRDQPLLDPPASNGLLGPGDAILLLLDIEKTLP